MKLADVSIRRPVLATVMASVLLVFGLFAYPRIGVDLFPEVEFPMVTVTAIYPGADPETVESKVVDKLEEAINSVTGIKVLRSTSQENVGFIFVQFELERDADQAVQDVRDKIATVLAQLPEDVDPPVVAKFDFGSAPILSVSLSGNLPIRELSRVAEKTFKEGLQTISGVGGIDIVGARDREFHVWVDPAKLESFGLAVGDVAQALVVQNVEIPGGRLDIGHQEWVVKTRGQVHTADALRQIVIMAANGTPIRIADVATVEDGEEEQRSASWTGGESAIALLIRKQTGANTVAVAHKVKAAVEKLRAQVPKGVEVRLAADNSIFIERSINDVKFDLAFGAVLTVLIILFFLRDWRATFISALALPTSVVATFTFMEMMHFTFNNMTMLALTLSIGILIDDAIVVIENIHRHLEMGKSAWRAAQEATAEIGLAVMATTASILAVFVPVATMKGIIGRFFLQFGLTVAVAVSVSLFVAFTLTPMLSARMLKLSHTRGAISAGIEKFLDFLDGSYRALLGLSLRHPHLTLGMGMAIFVASLGLTGLVPTEFLPEEDRGEFMVIVEKPTGTNLETTREFIGRVDDVIRRTPGVVSSFVTIGGGTQGEVNKGDIRVKLVPRHQRAFNQTAAMNFMRKQLAQFPDAVIAVEKVNDAGGGGFRSALVQFNIRGHDYGELNQAAETLIADMRAKGGYVDIDTSYRGGKPELTVNIDRDRAADLGVPMALLASTIRSFVAGDAVTDIATGGGRYDVRLRLPQAARNEPGDLLALKVRSQQGALVGLDNLVTVGEGSGPSKIERQNRLRQVTVFANLENKTLGQAVAEIEGVAKAKLPPTLITDWAGMGDVMQESFKYMLQALALAIILVYLILAAQFESFVHPFTIMLSLPLSVVGAFTGLLAAGMTINIFSMIGIIMLMGLVTKNAILLVDYTNTLRSQGMPRMQALLQAGPVRLRPILMTTAAMIFGMMPVALAQSEGGEQRAPMAVTVIGGLITSTLLTLVVVPSVYEILDRVADRIFRRAPGTAPAPASPGVSMQPGE